MPRGDLHQGAYFVAAGRKDDNVGRRVVVPRFTVTVMLELGRIGRRAIANERAKIRDERSAHRRREDRGHRGIVLFVICGCGLCLATMIASTTNHGDAESTETIFGTRVLRASVVRVRK